MLALLLALLLPPPTVEGPPSMSPPAPTEAILDEASIAPADELLAVLSQGFIGPSLPHTCDTNGGPTRQPYQVVRCLMKALREIERVDIDEASIASRVSIEKLSPLSECPCSSKCARHDT